VEHLNPVQIGVDVGQISDPSALAVTEVMRVEHGGRLDMEYLVRHMERLPLGTSYPAVAQRVAAVLASELLKQRRRLVRIDVTGVGRPVYELILQEVRTRPETRDAIIQPITFVHGEAFNERDGKLGKAYLVSRLQALLQRFGIHAPDTPEVRAMIEELKVYEIKIDQDGKDTYGAFKVGKHDDLVTALGLSCLSSAITGQELLTELKQRSDVREKGPKLQEQREKRYDWYW
jgi:hypothetical protein